MRRRKFTSGMGGAMAVLGVGGWRAAHGTELTESDAALGVRAALERGATAAIALLGKNGGFLDNSNVRIELPGFLKDAAKLLTFTGQQRRVDELVTAMNRAAEMAVPQARALLVGAVKSMSVDDGRQIVGGGGRSVTDFFERKTRAALSTTFLPIVARATEKVALAAKYDAVAGKAAGLGLVKQDDADIRRYVTGKALDGLYRTIGDEERKLRQDPLGSGSAILQKVFGAGR